MHPHAALIEKFYSSFAQRDADQMVSCYHASCSFRDPAFGDLRDAEVGMMWRMLLARSTDLKVSYRDVQADEASGTAHWEATYSFSQTRRLVHNRIDARFTFREGLIATHVDHFDIWRWAGQALGLRGQLLGWTPFVQQAIRRGAKESLARYMAKAK
jgi:hypothetical protein